MNASLMARIKNGFWLVLFLLATAAVTRAGDFTCMINSDNTVTITGYTGAGGAVVIPSTIDGMTVINIGYRAFYKCTSLTSVTIPNSVTNIDLGAFGLCDNLASVMIGDGVVSIGSAAFEGSRLTGVTLPAKVTSIGAAAFLGCTLLASVTIPNGVISIGGAAFCDCLSLTSITIPASVTSIAGPMFGSCIRLNAITVDAGNPVYCSVDGVLFDKGQTTIIECPNGKSGNYIIPAGVTNIGDGAFSACGNLTSVTIPDSVTSIGAGAFTFCGSIAGLYFKGNAPGLGSDVFVFSDLLTVYYLAGTTGWEATYGGRPTALWYGHTPIIKANGTEGEITVNNPDSMSITMEVEDNNAGAPVEWWVLSLAGASWYYLDNSYQWREFDGNLSNCHPLYQGASYNLPSTLLPALDITGLPVSSYTFWCAVDSQTDGILNTDGPIRTDSVDVNILSVLPPVPCVKANGAEEAITVNYPDAVAVTIEMNARDYAGVPVDWWVLLCDGSCWYYMDSVIGWTQFDGNLSNCHPVNQGALFNLPATEVLNMTGLPVGSYTFWFAVDYPMDGILNMGEIWVDSVNVNVQSHSQRHPSSASQQ